MHSDSARWSAAASSVLAASPGSTAWHACRSARNISGGTPSRLLAGAGATVPSCPVAVAVDDSTAGAGARARRRKRSGRCCLRYWRRSGRWRGRWCWCGRTRGLERGCGRRCGRLARVGSVRLGCRLPSLELEATVLLWTRNALPCRRQRRRLRHQVASCRAAPRWRIDEVHTLAAGLRHSSRCATGVAHRRRLVSFKKLKTRRAKGGN